MIKNMRKGGPGGLAQTDDLHQPCLWSTASYSFHEKQKLGQSLQNTIIKWEELCSQDPKL